MRQKGERAEEKVGEIMERAEGAESEVRTLVTLSLYPWPWIEPSRQRFHAAHTDDSIHYTSL